jgi:hypothetical protein
MATTPITLNIDTTLIAEAVTALCARGGYQANIPNPNGPGLIPNPVTQSQFAKQVLRDFVRNTILDQRNQAALQASQPVDVSLIS